MPDDTARGEHWIGVQSPSARAVHHRRQNASVCGSGTACYPDIACCFASSHKWSHDGFCFACPLTPSSAYICVSSSDSRAWRASQPQQGQRSAPPGSFRSSNALTMRGITRCCVSPFCYPSRLVPPGKCLNVPIVPACCTPPLPPSYRSACCLGGCAKC